MRKLRKNTSPSVPSISTIIMRAAEDGLAERGQAGDARRWRSVTAAAWKVNQATTPVSATADGHVVVDADHVGAQARIDCDRTVGEAAAGGYVPIEVRH